MSAPNPYSELLLPHRPDKLTVINLYGAPGRGKSTVRAGLFWLMKTSGMSVEEISEYAKYLSLKGCTWQLTEEQLFVFAQQHHQQVIVQRKGFQFAVTDSPLHLSAFYGAEHNHHALEPLIDEAHARFNNHHFFLSRLVPPGTFEHRGRAHDAQASALIEPRMRRYLRDKGIVCTDLVISARTPWDILALVAPGQPLAVPPPSLG